MRACRICVVKWRTVVVTAAVLLFLLGCFRTGQLIKSETIRVKTAADLPGIHCDRPIWHGAHCTAIGVEGMSRPKWRTSHFDTQGWSVNIPLTSQWDQITMTVDKFKVSVWARQANPNGPVEYRNEQP
jgi:hypothetical protein